MFIFSLTQNVCSVFLSLVNALWYIATLARIGADGTAMQLSQSIWRHRLVPPNDWTLPSRAFEWSSKHLCWGPLQSTLRWGVGHGVLSVGADGMVLWPSVHASKGHDDLLPWGLQFRRHCCVGCLCRTQGPSRIGTHQRHVMLKAYSSCMEGRGGQCGWTIGEGKGCLRDESAIW